MYEVHIRSVPSSQRTEDLHLVPPALQKRTPLRQRTNFIARHQYVTNEVFLKNTFDNRGDFVK